MEYVIETKGLCKQFPGKLAVDHVDMHVEKGDIYGFIGRNGAGKTTAMKVILGMLAPTEGEVFLFGQSDLPRQRKRIGSLIEAPGLFKNCTALENMRRQAILSGGNEQKIKEILDFVGLGNVGKRPAKFFSLGMKQRLGIALALLGEPEILILDEPINGLDPAGIKEVRDLIVKLNKEKGVTFLISSHLLDELGKIATRYGIINDGKLVDEVEATVLMERCRKNLKLRVDDKEKTKALLEKAKLLGEYKENEDGLSLFGDFEDSASINELLVKAGVKVKELSFGENAFEDYFIERLG